MCYVYTGGAPLWHCQCIRRIIQYIVHCHRLNSYLTLFKIKFIFFHTLNYFSYRAMFWPLLFLSSDCVFYTRINQVIGDQERRRSTVEEGEVGQDKCYFPTCKVGRWEMGIRKGTWKVRKWFFFLSFFLMRKCFKKPD